MELPTSAGRIELQRPPTGRAPAMFQRWDRLLFLHWEVDPEGIQQTLPPGLFVDCAHGRAFIGVVPFLMRRIRPRGLPPVPYISNFLECNVRTYVHDARGVPGVWFYSLDTDRWLAYKVARLLFHLPYYWASMSAAVGARTRYSVRRRDRNRSDVARFDYACRNGSAFRRAEAGTFEFFLLERYLLFAFDARRRRLFAGRVQHQPYQYAAADVTELSSSPIAWAGLQAPVTDPVHACVAAPVDVSVYALEPVPE